MEQGDMRPSLPGLTRQCSWGQFMWPFLNGTVCDVPSNHNPLISQLKPSHSLTLASINSPFSSFLVLGYSPICPNYLPCISIYVLMQSIKFLALLQGSSTWLRNLMPHGDGFRQCRRRLPELYNFLELYIHPHEFVTYFSSIEFRPLNRFFDCVPHHARGQTLSTE